MNDNNEYEYNYLDINYEINDISPLLELKRHNLIKNIKTNCNNYFIKNNLCINIDNLLPRWIMLQFNDKITYIDPILPYNADENKQLKKDLKIFSNKTLSENKINKIIIDLNLKDNFNKSIDELKLFIKSDIYKSNLYEPIIDVIEEEYFYKLILKFNDNTNIYIQNGINIDNEKFEFNLHKSVFEKMFFNFNQNKKENKENNIFIKLVMCIILRYNTLESYNQQLAILPDLNKYLHKKYNIDFELFASSINCFYNNYCSLFFDLEKYFGSKGNFNLLNIKKGFYVANPPFDEEIIKNMVIKLLKILKDNKDELSFFITIPVWNKPEYGIFEGVELIKKSKYLKYIENIKKSRSKFFDYFKNKFINPCNIYIIILQNKKGSLKYPIKDNIEKILLHFFPTENK